MNTINTMNTTNPINAVTHSTAAHDMSRLLRITKALQTEFRCNNCHQEYERKWCKADNTPCFFCVNFLPMRDTYTTILKDMEWFYLKSGETSRPEYYKVFLDNLSKWATKFHVFPTKDDLRTIEEMKGVQEATRDYWH